MLLFLGTLVLASCGGGDQPSADGGKCRSIEILVGFGVGGGTDLFARNTAQAMSKAVGTPVQVLNLTAGNGIAAYRELMNRPADGCTLLALTSDYVVLSTLQPDDINLSALTYLVRAHEELGLLVGRAEQQDQQFKGLVKAASDEQRALTIGGTGTRSFDRAVVDYVLADSTVDYRYISYGGSKSMHSDLLGGRIDLMYEEYSVIKPLIEAGQVRPVVALAAEVSQSNLSDAQTVVGAGLKTPPRIWRGLAMHGGTNPEAVALLSEALSEALAADSYVAYEQDRDLYQPAQRLEGPGFAARVSTERQLFADLIRPKP